MNLFGEAGSTIHQAAYAEAGYFEQAIKIAEECLTLAEAVDDIDLSHDVTRRIQLYRDRRPFHE